MRLDDFLKEVNAKEDNIGHYEGEEALEKVKLNGYNLRYVHHQTPEICLAAVKNNGLALQFVHHQTLEICLEAVKNDGYAIRFVDKSIFEKPTKGGE